MMVKYVGIVIVVFLINGCTIIHNVEVVRKGESRLNVEFETPLSMEIFNIAFESRSSAINAKKLPESTNISLIIINFYKKDVYVSDEGYRNDLLNEADLNGNFVVSEEEAKIFYNKSIAPYNRTHGIVGIDVISNMRVVKPHSFAEMNKISAKIIDTTTISFPVSVREKTKKSIQDALYGKDGFIDGDEHKIVYKFVSFVDKSGLIVKGDVDATIEISCLDNNNDIISKIIIDSKIKNANQRWVNYMSKDIGRLVSEYYRQKVNI